MPVINIGQADFAAAFNAASDAEERGDHEQALALDRLARKINAALSNAVVRGSGTALPVPITWKDVPSCLAPKFEIERTVP